MTTFIFFTGPAFAQGMAGQSSGLRARGLSDREISVIQGAPQDLTIPTALLATTWALGPPDQEVGDEYISNVRDEVELANVRPEDTALARIIMAYAPVALRITIITPCKERAVMDARVFTSCVEFCAYVVRVASENMPVNASYRRV